MDRHADPEKIPITGRAARLENTNMSLLRSLVAAFAAVQAGALMVCIGLVVVSDGPLSAIEGVGIWLAGQFIILPLAVLCAPLGALLRMVLGFVFDQPRPVALTTGTAIGVLGAALLAFTAEDGWIFWAASLSVGAIAGFVGGWVWWRIERPLFIAQIAGRPVIKAPTRR